MWLLGLGERALLGRHPPDAVVGHGQGRPLVLGRLEMLLHELESYTSKLVEPNYRVTHLLTNLGWVDLDLGCSTGRWAVLQLWCCPSKTVEHPKSKSNRSARRWVTLYGQPKSTSPDPWARVKVSELPENHAVFRADRLLQKLDAGAPHSLHEEEVGRLQYVADAVVVHPQDPRVHEVHQLGERSVEVEG